MLAACWDAEQLTHMLDASPTFIGLRGPISVVEVLQRFERRCPRSPRYFVAPSFRLATIAPWHGGPCSS
jgi:hypothetical protein